MSLNAEDDDEPAFLSLPPPDVQETWYPTLRVALWVLSCLYTYVDVSTSLDAPWRMLIPPSRRCSRILHRKQSPLVANPSHPRPICWQRRRTNPWMRDYSSSDIY